MVGFLTETEAFFPLMAERGRVREVGKRKEDDVAEAAKSAERNGHSAPLLRAVKKSGEREKRRERINATWSVPSVCITVTLKNVQNQLKIIMGIN